MLNFNKPCRHLANEMASEAVNNIYSNNLLSISVIDTGKQFTASMGNRAYRTRTQASLTVGSCTTNKRKSTGSVNCSKTRNLILHIAPDLYIYLNRAEADGVQPGSLACYKRYLTITPPRQDMLRLTTFLLK